MTAEQFIAAREDLVLTDDKLAAEMRVTPDVIRAWASGATRISPRHAEQLVWLVANAQRRAALQSSGLPECEWMRVWNDAPMPSGSAALIERGEKMIEHISACPVCLARSRYIEERFGPMPERPRAAWLRFFGWVDRVPGWAQPAAVGGFLLGAVVSLRVLFALPFLFSEPSKLAEALLAVVAAAGAGVAGGLAYSLTRPTLRKLGRPGDYLTGIVCVFAYMGSLALVAPIAFGESIFEDRASVVIFAIVSVFFGVFIGHSWFREPAKS